jgi:hypothetical protein
MNMGGYVAYIASDELSPSWMGRLLMTPAMEKPGEDTSMFVVDQLYGLPQYEIVINAAIGMILRDHGYNEPGSYNSRDHGGRTVHQYIYNSVENPRAFTNTVTRRGGRAGSSTSDSTGGVGGVRYSEMMGEVWRDALEQCIALVTAGNVVTAKDADATTRKFKTEDECVEIFDVKPLGNGMYDSINPGTLDAMLRANLVPKDLYRNILHSDNWTFYDGGTSNPTLDQISDSALASMKKTVSVTRVKDLSTLRERAGA